MDSRTVSHTYQDAMDLLTVLYESRIVTELRREFFGDPLCGVQLRPASRLIRKCASSPVAAGAAATGFQPQAVSR